MSPARRLDALPGSAPLGWERTTAIDLATIGAAFLAGALFWSLLR